MAKSSRRTGLSTSCLKIEELSNEGRAELWQLAAQPVATRVQLQGEAETDVLDIGAILTLREPMSGREVSVRLVPDLDAVWRKVKVLMVSREFPTEQTLSRPGSGRFTGSEMGSAQELVCEILLQGHAPGD
ncbi:hypothetical protein [Deinococcus humi]|uniref:Uncharacterized protein n=1 Tax=Deinococcus humi TaxID=662880 RepID=A0A7W8JWS8_9DEIO|nr:hypothetical protein [Deinococcus humi]MBB5364579.1 hypothetical protein [Deinococcus humi]GGO38265.1 hypothetical protein GCM10008949_44570 [Deinococcus humi]